MNINSSPTRTRQNGSAKLTLLIVGVALAGILLIAAVYLVGIYNTAVQQENGVMAVHKDYQNVHASVFNSLKSQGLSIEKYGELVLKAIDAGMSGRYGEDGVKGAMVWIKEQNLGIEPALFLKLQTIIESGYARMESTQRSKIDRIRVLDNFLESAPKGMIARKLFGFPKKVTDDVRATITSAATEEMMKTKKMETIDPFSKK